MSILHRLELIYKHYITKDKYTSELYLARPYPSNTAYEPYSTALILFVVDRLGQHMRCIL